MDHLSQLLVNIFFLCGLFVTISIVLKLTITGILQIKDLWATERSFKKKMNVVKKMKAEGEHHDWIQVVVGDKEYHVCQKTGWCPTLEGFVSLEHIKEWQKSKKDLDDYTEYRDDQVKLIAEKYGLSLEDTEKIIESVLDIKRQWMLLKIAKSQQEDEKKKDGK